jgi:predicted transposase YdaD
VKEEIVVKSTLDSFTYDFNVCGKKISRRNTIKMGEWDGQMKHLVGIAQEDFVSWLVEGARFDKELSANFATRKRDGDNLWQIEIEDKPSLLHLEFQLKPDENMGRRMWEYNVDAAIKYQLPVESVVIYLKKPGHSKAAPPYRLRLPNGKVIHTFSFIVIDLCKVKTKSLLQRGLKGLLPLVPLTENGQDRDAIEYVIKELRQPGVEKAGELLTLTYGLAALVFKKESEHDWLQRRFAMLEDVINESWAFQEIIQKGIAQGREQGIAQGIAQGREQGLQAQRQSLLLLVQKQYPALLQLTHNVCNTVQNIEKLQEIFEKVLNAKNEQEAQQTILDAKR